MPGHVYVDETKAKGYLMVAVTVSDGQLAGARRQLRSLLKPGLRRLHFVRDNDDLRIRALKTIGALGLTAAIYDASACSPERQARDLCIGAIVCDAAEQQCSRVIFELDQTLATRDRQVLYQAVQKFGLENDLVYSLQQGYEEPLLWLPDAVAWCWARGGRWRQAVAPMVNAVVDISG